jgi:hypothetical protein
MTEPSAIKIRDLQVAGSTSIGLDIHIRPAEGKADTEKPLGQLPQSFRRLIFNVDSTFRLKTFARNPGQTMLTTRGPIRLRDEFIKLQSILHAKPFESWQRPLLDQPPSYLTVGETSPSARFDRRHTRSASAGLSSSWTPHISVPIQTPAGLLPTFCSAVVARNYSIITRVKFSNAHAKPVTLEVPVQIIYSPVRTVGITAAVDRWVPSPTTLCDMLTGCSVVPASELDMKKVSCPRYHFSS